MSQDIRKIVEEGYDSGDYAGAFRVSDDLDSTAAHFLRRFADILPAKGRVLDLGCGPGVPFDRWLVSQGFTVTGIDISQKHIDLAKRNVPEATYIKADFTTLALDSESFDGILSLYAIFHIPRQEQGTLLAQIHHWLRPGGSMLLSVGTSDSEYGEDENWFGAPKMVWSSFSPEIYEQMIRSTGFTMVESGYEGNPGDEEYHFWVLASKR
jgi:2-polyprenyl-3-methyl-5-hydroxy-6-metoxy-1,4-benzoquinol methylase